MRYRSTRDRSLRHSFSEAVDRGLAPEGGLYVPEHLPPRTVADFDGCESLAQFAERLLRPMLEGDPLAPALERVCAEALDFPVPLRALDERSFLLELFHGPTAAFKDVGARFLAACWRQAGERASERTILVATSGDTGSAIAAAFDAQSSVQVVILYPQGRVSPRQEQQLCCWGDNVHSFRVDGSFDDCQRLVKQAFADAEWRATRRLSSANSINIGRLLPQASYYAMVAVHHARQGRSPPRVIVPSGNVGNACAALWVKAMGLPLGEVMLATNANRPVPDYFEHGRWEPRPSVATLANAMDVGEPSNMERVRDLHPSWEELRAVAGARSCDDEAIRATIRRVHRRHGLAICPHTAAAFHDRELRPEDEAVLVATAHPAKFETVVEPLVGEALALPPGLDALLNRPRRCRDLRPSLSELKAALDDRTP